MAASREATTWMRALSQEAETRPDTWGRSHHSLAVSAREHYLLERARAEDNATILIILILIERVFWCFIVYRALRGRTTVHITIQPQRPSRPSVIPLLNMLPRPECNTVELLRRQLAGRPDDRERGAVLRPAKHLRRRKQQRPKCPVERRVGQGRALLRVVRDKVRWVRTRLDIVSTGVYAHSLAISWLI